MIATITTHLKQENELKYKIVPVPKTLTREIMSGKEKTSTLALDFPSMVSAPVVLTSASEPVSTSDGDEELTSSFSVSTVTRY